MVGEPVVLGPGPERAGLPIRVLAEFPVIETVTLPPLDQRLGRGTIKSPERRVSTGSTEGCPSRTPPEIEVHAGSPT